MDVERAVVEKALVGVLAELKKLRETLAVVQAENTALREALQQSCHQKKHDECLAATNLISSC